MEDVYFERIAGVGERKGATPRQPQGAAPVQHVGPPVLNMALDDDMHVVDYDPSVPEPVVQQQQNDIPCDENGFPTSPLRDQEDLWFIQDAALYRPLAKGVSTARTSGMFLLVSGILTILVGAVSVDMVAVVVGLIVATLGTMERGAANDLALAKPSAPFRLALNQVLLLGLIIASSWMTVQSVTAHAAAAKPVVVDDAALTGLPQDVQGVARQAGAQLAELAPKMVYLVFTVIVIASVVFQGGLAAYYLTRRRKVREFNDELPPWVSEIVTTVAAR